MAVRIRLMRMGSKRRPFYRFVVADSRGKRDGGFLDQIGTYNPIVVPQEIKVDEDRLFEWLRKGAGLSDGARSLLKKHGTLARWGVAQGGPGAVAPEDVKAAAKDEAPEEVVEDVQERAVGEADEAAPKATKDVTEEVTEEPEDKSNA